jgi:hypothetical protein
MECWRLIGARAIRDKQKENSVSMLEGWKDVLAGKKLTREEVENYVRLAEYNVNGGRKGRPAATPVKSGTGRRQRFDRAAGELTSDEASSKAAPPAVSLDLLDPHDAEGIDRSRSRCMSTLGSSKKRKLEDTIISTPNNTLQELEIKWPISECISGKSTNQKVANAGACGMSADTCINFV